MHTNQDLLFRRHGRLNIRLQFPWTDWRQIVYRVDVADPRDGDEEVEAAGAVLERDPQVVGEVALQRGEVDAASEVGRINLHDLLSYFDRVYELKVEYMCDTL